MARIPPSPHRDCEFRYYLAYDWAHGDDMQERIYGMVKIPMRNTWIGNGRIEFYNDTSGKINLAIREVKESEWGTYEAFDLFPILHVFSVVQELHQDILTLKKHTVTISRVRFNDH